MSNPRKKQSDMHSAIPSQPRVVGLHGEVVSNAEELLEIVSVDTPAVLAFKEGRSPFHTVCGSRCSYTLHSVPGMFGQLHFGVVCTRCLRALMEGEITYAFDSIESSIHSESDD